MAAEIHPSEFMTPAELRDLTQRALREAQKVELLAMGIPHRMQRGRLLVSRVHVRDWLAGVPSAIVRRPNLNAVK